MYYLIMNKSPTVPLPYAIGIVQSDEILKYLYNEYISERRDKYDPYEFIEWLEKRYKIKMFKPGSAVFNKHEDTATVFNFHKPNGKVLAPVKGVRNVKTRKSSRKARIKIRSST